MTCTPWGRLLGADQSLHGRDESANRSDRSSAWYGVARGNGEEERRLQEGVRHDTRNFEAHKHSAAGERCVLVVDDDRLSSSASSTARPSTSCSLPRLSGRQLAKRLGAMGPEMKVLFMSGYPDGTILHLGVLDSGVACLQKPLTPASLARGVSEVLRGS